MKKIFGLIPIAILAFTVTLLTGLPVLAAGAGLIALSAFTPKIEGAAFAGLNKEIWLDEILEGFYADDMFLSEMRDMSAFVDNNTINLAEAGVDPNVLINNNSYPIAVNSRTDIPIALPLDTYDTENTRIRAIEKAELAYDKVKSVTEGHKNALRMTFMEKAAHTLVPSSNGTYTPIIKASGADNGKGEKRLKYSDVDALATAFNDAEIPAEGRILVLSSQHQSDLRIEDSDRLNRMMDKGALAGFKLYFLASKRLPRYNKTNGTKVAWGAAANPSTDVRASFAFHKDEVMRAKGSVNMFATLNSATDRSDVFGFQMRGLSMPIRGKGIAAIYSEPSSPNPVILSITPEPEAPAGVVTITGYNFTGVTGVKFGSTPGTSVTLVNDGELTVVIPSIADNHYDVTVTNADGTSAGFDFEVKA